MLALIRAGSKTFSQALHLPGFGEQESTKHPHIGSKYLEAVKAKNKLFILSKP